MTILPALPNTTSMNGHSQTVKLIEKHTGRADSLINAKCAQRYSLPFDPVPPLIRACSEEITSWFVYRSEFGQSSRRTSIHELEYRDALDWLNELSDGTSFLVDSLGSLLPALTTATTSLVDSSTIDYQCFFGEDDAFNWKVDDDKLDDLAENR